MTSGTGTMQPAAAAPRNGNLAAWRQTAPMGAVLFWFLGLFFALFVVFL